MAPTRRKLPRKVKLRRCDKDCSASSKMYNTEQPLFLIELCQQTSAPHSKIRDRWLRYDFHFSHPTCFFLIFFYSIAPESEPCLLSTTHFFLLPLSVPRDCQAELGPIFSPATYFHSNLRSESAMQNKYSSSAVASLMIAVVFIVLSTVAVALRIAGRRIKRTSLWYDDYMILAALVVYIWKIE